MSLKILVIGASQGTGAHAVRHALERGHQVTAFARTPARLGLEHPNLTLVAGDFHDQASVEKAVEGHDAVIITASAAKLKTFKEKPDFFSSGTRYAIEAMKKNGIRKLVILSALGVGESRPLLPLPLRFLIVDLLLKRPYVDHALQEKLAMESGLDWVVVRPGTLTDKAPKGRDKVVVKQELSAVPFNIARADLGGLLVEACEKTDWDRSAVQVGA